MILRPLFCAFVLCIGCTSDKSDLPSAKKGEPVNNTNVFSGSNTLIKNPVTGQLMRAVHYNLPAHPKSDTVYLSPLYWEQPTTNGMFSMLTINKGEQYNIALPAGAGYVFLNAATLFYLNTSGDRPFLIIQGKAWLNTWDKKATIKVDEALIDVGPNSKINVENYSNGPDNIITLVEGTAFLRRYNEIMTMKKNDEIWINKNTGNLQRKMASIDASAWTSGWLRHFCISNDYMFRELTRLFNKNIQFKGSNQANTFPNIEYRHHSLYHILDYLGKMHGYNYNVENDTIWISK